MHETAATLSPFDAAAIVIVVAAILGFFNHRVLKLPHVIGLTVMGAVASLGLTLLNYLFPVLTFDNRVALFLAQIDFEQTLMEGMLSSCCSRGRSTSISRS